VEKKVYTVFGSISAAVRFDPSFLYPIVLASCCDANTVTLTKQEQRQKTSLFAGKNSVLFQKSSSGSSLFRGQFV
jgi:hypothetical protein